ncbi:hypothetical protein [Campylobacter showae]|uniref:Uncharacterized protein n=1 Tax=Campylobacter showae CSUNSWCD TaxID=1244083 RepID=M5IPP6_9BACT|nr:hypothetical protein [Campylobacter showae]EKU10093.1 hypothetical protein CSUNSWCD_1457 [Campylobacter showae CSUNSWCD]
MQSLFQTEPTQVEILNFQTFTTEYVAERYGVSTTNIKVHKREHADEIIEGIHFVVVKNDRNRPVIKWTLRGIIKLGMFIRSKEAKNFRLWAEQELEKTILSELAQAKETKARNVELSHKYADLEAYAKFEAKRHGDQINGYLGQLAKHNALIASLKTELAKRGKIYDAEVIERYEDREENLRAQLHNAKAERDFYFKRTQELKQKQNIKDSEIVRLLNKIQYQMDGVYSEIGAVMAYANDNDRFFIEQNQILKG